MRTSRHSFGRSAILAGLCVGAIAAPAVASAQGFGRGWFSLCVDPTRTDSPYSDDYNIDIVESDLFSISAGRGGTVALGAESLGPPANFVCFKPGTFNAQSGFAFGIPAGSLQAQGADTGMALSMGWDSDPVAPYTFFRISDRSNAAESSVLFGEGGYSTMYTGSSKRYFVLGDDVTVDGTDFYVELAARVVGDAVQMRWRMNNRGTTSTSAGVLFGCSPFQILASNPAGFDRRVSHVAMSYRFNTDEPSSAGTNQRYIGFSATDATRPIRLESKFPSNVAGYPKWAKFLWSQSNPWGLQIDTQPDKLIYKDADSSDLLVVANRQQILHDDMSMSFNLFGDNTGNVLQNDILIGYQATSSLLPWGTGFLQRFPAKTVSPGNYTDIVHYVHLSHTEGFYFDPYTLVLDAPSLVPWSSTAGTANGYADTVSVGAWLDNQYADVDKEVTLNNVRMTITLPANAGLMLAPGETRVKNIGTVAPNGMRNASWNLVVDPAHPGLVEMKIEVETFPGPVRTLTKQIRIAGSPQYTLNAGANLVAFPYAPRDTSLDATLVKNEIDPNTGEYVKLQNGKDYVAYTWDPTLRTYVPAQSIQRGVGMWFVPAAAAALDSIVMKQSTAPTDGNEGGLITGLVSGWNLIGNPYSVPVKLGEMTGVTEDNPETAKSWDELVRTSAVSGALTYWDGTSYQNIAGNDAVLEPGKGYWLFVTNAAPVRLVYPPSFYIGTPDITQRGTKPTFKNTDQQWRLQLAAASASGYDNSTFVGVTRDTRNLNTLNVPKPPAAPNSSLEVAAIGQTKLGDTRMAQLLSTSTQKGEWKVQVKSEKPGEVTLTWPNLATLPRGVRLTLTDDATGETKDLRAVSGYTTAFAQAGTRNFTIKASATGASRPVITSALVSRSTRDANSPVEISYALSDSALVTVRVLSASGKEIYTATRGRADGAGQNSVVWTLRDSANRAVAPGTYRVEIIAETTSGERARRIVPVNVIR